MATSLDVAAHDADSLAKGVSDLLGSQLGEERTNLSLTTNNGDSVLLGSGVYLIGLDTGAELDGRAGVGRVGVLLDVVDALQLVSPDGQRTVTGRFGVEVMTSVLDDKTQVEVTSEVDGELDLVHAGGGNGIRRVSSNAAGRATERGGQAGVALVQDGIDGSRILSPSGCQYVLCQELEWFK